jgi:hypothetical protein
LGCELLQGEREWSERLLQLIEGDELLWWRGVG